MTSLEGIMAMEYRELGKTGVMVSALGLGTEHVLKEPGTLDRILGMAVDAGVSYVDLLWTMPEYWDEHGAEIAAHRDQLAPALHWNAPDCHDNDISQASFDGMLGYLGGHAEVGLVTMIESEADWKGWGREAVERLQAYKRDGRIGAVAVSGHYPETARKVIESGTIDAYMFGMNLLGQENEKEATLRQACLANDVSLVVMKPLHGGRLLVAEGKPTGITPSQCLDYVLGLPAVATTVPGPKTESEWAEVLHYLEATAEERSFEGSMEHLQKVLAGQCVQCFHCEPCPEALSIAWLIWCVDAARDGVTDQLRKEYAGFEHTASECVQCGLCLERCPYDVDIMAKLEQAVVLFE
jgi:uncharacterized protein